MISTYVFSTLCSKSNGLIDTLENVTDAENIHGLAKKIIAVESALFVTKQLVDLKTFIMTPIEKESVNMYFTEVNIFFLSFIDHFDKV